MELLFKRNQSKPGIKVKFKLWAKVELEEDEKTIVNRYNFNDSVLIAAVQENLIRNTIIVGVVVFVVASFLLSNLFGFGLSVTLGLLAGIGAGYYFFNEKRETIFVRDLIHGRYFSCDSVVDLARKEAWLHVVVGFLRQVMESAKHWDGTEHHTVEPLPPEEARQVIIKGL